MNQPTDENRLARWLHETYRRHYPDSAIQSWAGLTDRAKEPYFFLARELLANPPPCLRKSLRKLEATP